MNYIDITQADQALHININFSGLFTESDIGFYIYKDGTDSGSELFGCSLENNNYYHTITLPNFILETLEDETQYTIEAFDFGEVKDADESGNIIYRGKFQTTSKDILDYSINENKYTQKTNTTNYTILD